MTADSSIPDTPLQYHEYLAVLATLDGFLKDQRDPTPMLKEKRDFYLSLMKQDAINRKDDQARVVVSMDDSGFGYLF